jgi:peptidoglycan hydrolase-like protein with peptidoglycan-binding domain
VAEHRFLRSTHVIALLDRPAKKILERLAALYHNAYLEQSQSTLSSAASATRTQSAQITQTKYTFTQNLQYLDTSPEVGQLQKYLNDHGFDLAQSGPGSSGEETDHFGSLTYAALVKFQDAYAAEILAPVGLTQGSGYFGPATRAFVNDN